MSPHPRVFDWETTLRSALEQLDEEPLAALVLDGGLIAGVLTADDVLRELTWAGESRSERAAAISEALARPVGDASRMPLEFCPDTADLTEACQRMVRSNTSVVPIVRGMEVVGFLPAMDIVGALATPGDGRERPLVGAWMSEVQHIDPRASLVHALELMTDAEVRHLLVTREGRLEGILSNRDIVRAANRLELDLSSCRAETIMTRAPLHQTSLHAPLEAAAGLMSRHRVSALPVLEGTRLAGIITSQHLLEAAATRVFGRATITESEPRHRSSGAGRPG